MARNLFSPHRQFRSCPNRRSGGIDGRADLPQTYDDMVSTFGQPHRRDGGYDIYIGPDGRNYWVRYDETNTAISLEIK